MTRKMIITELKKHGYEASAHTTIKNGVEFHGICISTGTNIAPVIYTDDLIHHAEANGLGLDDVVAKIIDIYESNRTLDFDIQTLYDTDFLKSHLFIGMQKKSDAPLVKRPCDFDGIECYLYIQGNEMNDGSYSIRVTEHLLEQTGLSEVEAWKYAEDNTKCEATIQSMGMVIAELMGLEYTEDMDEISPLYVVSNHRKFNGASSILNKEMLSEFATEHNTNRIVVFPSSIHEMMILPHVEDISIDEYSAMVGEINCSQVRPEERLTDRAYIINF